MTREIPNRYAGTCRDCGRPVSAGAGHAQLDRPKHEGGVWTIQCHPCKSGETPAPAPATVELDKRPSLPMTEEQEAAVRMFATGSTIAIQAGAGTGKTTTLVAIARSTDRTGSYVAFNRKIVDEAALKFPRNVGCRTMHKLAHQQVGHLYKHREGARLRSAVLARILGLEPYFVEYGGQRKVIQPSTLASYVMLAIRNFCNTADARPSPRHMPYVQGIDLPTTDGHRTYAENDKVREHCRQAITRAWDDIVDVNGALPFSPDHFLKIWQLGIHGTPTIPGEFILFDEAQDASPVMLSVVEQQGKQVVYVGDSQQAIYEWRGAVDALDNVTSDDTAYLTHSFRFGEGIAGVANTILASISGATLRIVGRGQASTIGRTDRPTCVLTRTNAGAITVVLEALENGLQPHLVGGAGEVRSFVLGAQMLKEKGYTTHPDLACFTSWAEVQAYVESDPQGGDLALMVGLIDKYGIDTILRAVANEVPEQDADVVVSTAHKSKGCEWDSVRIHGDFSPDNLADAERRLLYVAATRARRHLDYSDCQALTTIMEPPKGDGPDGGARPLPLPPVEVAEERPEEAEATDQATTEPEALTRVTQTVSRPAGAAQDMVILGPPPAAPPRKHAEPGAAPGQAPAAAPRESADARDRRDVSGEGEPHMYIGRCLPGCKHAFKTRGHLVIENHRLVGLFDAEGNRVVIPRCPDHGRRPYMQELRVGPTKGDRCHPACWNAMSDYCECPCRGHNHGTGHAPDEQQAQMIAMARRP